MRELNGRGQFDGPGPVGIVVTESPAEFGKGAALETHVFLHDDVSYGLGGGIGRGGPVDVKGGVVGPLQRGDEGARRHPALSVVREELGADAFLADDVGEADLGRFGRQGVFEGLAHRGDLLSGDLFDGGVSDAVPPDDAGEGVDFESLEGFGDGALDGFSELELLSHVAAFGLGIDFDHGAFSGVVGADDLHDDGGDGLFGGAFLLFGVVFPGGVEDVDADEDAGDLKALGDGDPPYAHAAFGEDLARDPLEDDGGFFSRRAAGRGRRC